MPGDSPLELQAGESNLLGAVAEQLGRLIERLDVRKEAQERQLKLIQADKLSSLGMMVAGVAHEINNPVNNILLNASLLRDFMQDAIPILDVRRQEQGEFPAGGLPYSEMRESVPELVRGVLEGCERIKTITNDLRDATPGQIESVGESASVNRAVSAALRMCAHMDIHFVGRTSVELSEGMPPVRGSHRRLEQVLVNLLQNAWQALQGLEARIFVTTRQAVESGMVEVEVRDEGCGMAPEVLARIKEPFYTTRRGRGGTGLGIAISNNIVEEMGGRLEFESVVGKGTTARVCLPASGEQGAESRE